MQNFHLPQMTFAEFTALVQATPDGVVLLEGRREISPDAADQARRVARLLATRFPRLRFRSGNASGSDEAFSQAIAAVDPTRLQIVLPYATHRKSARIPGVHYATLAELTPEQEDELVRKTTAATPCNQTLIESRHRNKALAAKAAYLLRDTLKTLGHSAAFPKPIFALFLVDPSDPMRGGTGHTIRACRHASIPHAFQNAWRFWGVED
jgi:hypothetical protein